MIHTDFSSLFDLLPIGAYRSSPSGRQLRANAALVSLNGYDSEADLLVSIADIAAEWYCQPGRRDAFISLLQTHGRVVDFVSQVYRHKTRERIWVREVAHQVFDAQGRVLYFEGTVQDISLDYQTRLDLQASESRFRAMTELSSDWYWELDENHRFIRLDVGRNSLSRGFSRDVLGKTRQELPQLEMSESQWTAYQVLLDAQRIFQDFELPMRALNGELTWHAISGEPTFNSLGQFTGYRGIGRDVTTRKQDEEVIRQMAFHDALTGLANRRLFMDRLQQALAGMARSGQRSVLMFIDLDKFKALNDQRGHDVGDLLLQQVAQRLKACVRSIDTVARLGGDEFAVLLQEVGPDATLAAQHASTMANKLLLALQTPFDLVCPGVLPYQGGASLGVVVLHDPLCSPQACLKQADAVMYQAKARGRNQIGFVAGPASR